MNFPIKRFFGTFNVVRVNGDRRQEYVWLQKILILVMWKMWIPKYI